MGALGDVGYERDTIGMFWLTMVMLRLKFAPVAQSHAQLWAVFSRHVLSVIEGLDNARDHSPVGRGGRFGGVVVMREASAGTVTVAVNCL